MSASTTPSPTAPNEAADELAQYLRDTGRVGPQELLGTALRTERLRVVEHVRNEVGLDEGWEQRPNGVSRINPFDLDRVLEHAVAGLSGEEPSDPDFAADVERARKRGTDR